MAQLRQSSQIPTAELRVRPLSADFFEVPSSSRLYTMLPSSLQSKIPRLPSLRRTMSMYNSVSKTTTGHRHSTGSTSSYGSRSGSQTPPPTYISALADSEGSCAIASDGDMLSYTSKSILRIAEDDRPSTSSSSPPALPSVSDTKVGVNWKFASQGSHLLSAAVEESAVAQDSRDGDVAFSRQLYVHGLTYLLRGLPTDLSPEEQFSLRAAIPATVQPQQSDRPFPQYAVDLSSHSPPSILHRALAATIVQFFILLQFLLPHLKVLLRWAYSYEREHRISERLIASGIDAVDSLGKRSVEIGGLVSAMGDGRVGQVINEMAAWWLEGVIGGVYEGIGEGMVIMGAKRPPNAQMKTRF